MIHALLPVYLVTSLGASTLAVGFIEGIAEATASITKVFSGALVGLAGPAQGAGGRSATAWPRFTKPVFPLATTLGWVVAARFVDRIGKGIRGAPRDALIADLAPPDLRGASLRPAPVAGHGRRLPRPVPGHRPDVADLGQPPAGVLGGGRAGRSLAFRPDPVRGARAGARRGKTARAFAAVAGASWGACHRCTGGSWRVVGGVHPGAVQRGVPGPACAGTRD